MARRGRADERDDARLDVLDAAHNRELGIEPLVVLVRFAADVRARTLAEQRHNVARHIAEGLAHLNRGANRLEDLLVGAHALEHRLAALDLHLPAQREHLTGGGGGGGGVRSE